MTIQYTASQQWDELLDVAKAWAAMDRRAENDTSEEEAEEGFLDDGDTTTRYVAALYPAAYTHVERSSRQAEGEHSDVPEIPDDEGEDEEVGPPPPTISQTSYAQSPTKEKREKLEQLAARKRPRR